MQIELAKPPEKYLAVTRSGMLRQVDLILDEATRRKRLKAREEELLHGNKSQWLGPDLLALDIDLLAEDKLFGGETVPAVLHIPPRLRGRGPLFHRRLPRPRSGPVPGAADHEGEADGQRTATAGAVGFFGI